MTSLFTLDEWRWERGVTPFSHVGYPLAASLLYLIVVFGGKLVMKNRKEMSLRTVSIIHNVNLTALSGIMFVAILREAWFQAKREGPHSLFCETSTNAVSGGIGFWVYVFYLSKYYELLDTVILVLKKKPTIFLHVFHHMIMVPTTWLWLDDQWLAASWWCVLVNSLVHMFMYYYYLQTTLGSSVWWKKYITVGQLVQFFSGFCVVCYWFVVRKSHNCQGGIYSGTLSHSLNCFFIFLFGKFYLSTYSKKRAPGEKRGKKEE